jgi:hypothetical protein
MLPRGGQANPRSLVVRTERESGQAIADGVRGREKLVA